MSQDLAQALSLAHDELHKGNVEKAHHIIHAALGLDDKVVIDRSKQFFREFDVDFLAAVRKNNVAAAYIIFEQDNPANPRQVRIVTGGDLFAVELLKRMVAAGGQAIGTYAKAR